MILGVRHVHFALAPLRLTHGKYTLILVLSAAINFTPVMSDFSFGFPDAFG